MTGDRPGGRPAGWFRIPRMTNGGGYAMAVVLTAGLLIGNPSVLLDSGGL